MGVTYPLAPRSLREERERNKKRRFILDRCFNRFRVLELDQLRGLPCANGSTQLPGVYFLWQGPRLVYVGQGSELRDRLAFHRRTGKRFTHATYESLHAYCTRWCESQYIKRHKPPMNKIGK
jgi:hypothetical protein